MQTLKVPQIAKIIGKTDKTVHNHREKGKLTMEKDADGEYAAHISEVQRAYSNIPGIEERIKSFFSSNPASNENEEGQGASAPVNTPAELEAIKEKYEALLAREREHVEEMKEAYDKSLSTVDAMTKLLEHQTSETQNLSKAIAKIIERDQQREERRVQALKKREAEKQKQEAQEKLDAEKNKGFFQRFFK